MSKRVGDLTTNAFYRDVRRNSNRLLNAMLGTNANVDLVELDNIIPNEIGVENNNPIELNDQLVVLNEPENNINDDDINNPIELHNEIIHPNEVLEPVEFVFNDSDDENHTDDDENNFEVNVVESYRVKLANFVKKSNLSRELTNELLKLQREFGHPELPKTRETLCGTPRHSIHPRPCGDGGEYYHFGIQNGLIKCNYRFLFEEDHVFIDIGIDGLALSNSSKLKVWPIIGKFVNKPNTSPFLIGCYKGTTDPSCIDSFTFDFVEEMKVIQENGVKVTPNCVIKPLSIRAFICDTPARSLTTGCFGHASYHGCSKCDQVSDFTNKMIYQPIRTNDRTDATFSNREDPGHHQPQFQDQRSLLETIGIGMVSQFPIDPMHAVDSGIMKRILGSILNGPCNSCHLRGEGRDLMDAVNLRMIPYIPSDFERKPRSLLTEYPRFKAVEFRLFLLYTGI